MKRIWVIALVAACTHAKDSGPSTELDAGTTGPTCSDGVCDVGETLESCPADCARCGDLICSPGETGAMCPVDCPICGDGKCDHDETLASCEADCAVCGDDQCSGAEDPTTCGHDCAVCGDGLCTKDETSTTCAQDCMSAVKLQNDSSYTLYHFFARSCASGDWGPNLLGANVVTSGSSFTLSSVPPGCYYFKAENASATLFWQSPSVVLTPGQTYTWNILN